MENPCVSNNNSGMQVTVMKNSVQMADMNADKGAMVNFMNSLQVSGVQVVENNSDKTLSLSLPNRSLDDQNYVAKQKIIPVSTTPFDAGVPIEQMYKLIESGGNVAIITTGPSSEDGEQNKLSSMPMMNSTKVEEER